MDATASSQLPHSAEPFLQQLEEMSVKIDALMQAQEVQGEVQFELAKLLQRILQTQEDAEAKIEGLSAAFISTSDGSLRGEFAKIGLGLLQESRARAQDLSTIKQSANMALREQTRGVFPIRVVFLVHSIPMWDALADVHAAMMQDDRFDPVVITINFTPLGRGAFAGEDKVSEAFSRMGIAHLRFNMEDSYAALDILKALRPAVIFRQQQWDMCLQPAFRTHELTFTRLCLVPYALNLAATFGDPIVTDVSALGFDQNYHRSAWRIFCETPITQGYFNSFAHSHPEKLVLSGYPKFDRLVQEKDNPQWPVSHEGGRNYRVIWAPHYSLGKGGGLGFGVFDRIWESMVAWAKSSPDIDFVLKPHPALFAGVMSGEMEKAFKDAWAALPNCAISEAQYGQLFAASDMMVTDGLSFLAEYPLFDKPLVYFDSGNHVPFNDLGTLAEAAARRVTTFDQLRQAVLEYKSGKVWEFEKERETLLTHILPNPGMASASILDAIATGIEEGRS